MKVLNNGANEFNKSLREVYGANCKEFTARDSDAPWRNNMLERLKKKLRSV